MGSTNLSMIAMAIIVTEIVLSPVMSFPTGCVWRSSVSASLPESQTVSPQAECQQGQLQWNNPRGQLTASFSRDGARPEFCLCLWAPDHNGALSQTVDVSRDPPVPIQLHHEEPVCVESVGGSVVIRFVAADNLAELLLIEYATQNPP